MAIIQQTLSFRSILDNFSPAWGCFILANCSRNLSGSFCRQRDFAIINPLGIAHDFVEWNRSDFMVELTDLKRALETAQAHLGKTQDYL